MNGLLARFWPIIALAFPVLEIVGLALTWGRIGAWTLLWLLLAALAGAALIALERVAFLPALAAAVLAGKSPLASMQASGLRFLAGLLLIFPGVLSDALALCLVAWAGLRPPPPPRRPVDDGVIEGEFRRVDD